MLNALPPLTALREPHLAAFAPALNAASLTADAQAWFEAFAHSPFYEDRFAVWSMRTQSTLKQKRNSSTPNADRDASERRRRAATTAVAMRMVQLLGERPPR